jgi:hypothetical protein
LNSNIKRHNPTAADANMLGYLFQIERAVAWLSKLPSDAKVGVEVADDIVIHLNKGETLDTIYEQAKHTVKKKVPYADSSIDLWKTLFNWINAINRGDIDPSKTIFSIFCNKQIPSTRLVYQLNNAKAADAKALEEAYNDLIKVAKSLRTKAMKPYGKLVVDTDKKVLLELINNITILDTQYSHTRIEYIQLVKDELHLSDNLPINDIIDKLSGFVMNYLIDKWRNREEAWISVSVFNKQAVQLIAEHVKKSFVEQTTSLLPVASQLIKKGKTKTFANQLDLIGCNEDEILEAIHDYFRALSERDRYARDGEISSDKLELYFNELKSNWQTISRPRFKFIDGASKEQIGYEVFYESLKYKGKLNGFEPEQSYTFKGAYHHLSNELEIGWHPDWEALLK